MKEILLNPTLIGVIIGSLLALVGNVLTQYFSLKKEERQWERQRISSREEREETLNSKNTENLTELYHKCVLSLSVYIINNQNNSNEKKQNNLADEIKEIHQWLSLLLLRHPHKKLNRLIDSFLFDPDEYNAEELRKYVLALVEQEEKLMSPNRIKEVVGKKELNNEKARAITFRISEGYRRQQMVAGIELPQSYFYSYEFEDLNAHHRERLLKVYFQSMKRIPDNAQLFLPTYAPKAKQINYQGKQWEANINPNSSNVNEVLDKWGKDFDKYLNEAEQVLAAQNA